MRLRVVDAHSLAGGDRRGLSDDQRAADPALAAEGWELRFIADESRAREASQLYAEIGFEVRDEPIVPESPDDCQPCQASAVRFHAIYTRGGRAGESSSKSR